MFHAKALNVKGLIFYGKLTVKAMPGDKVILMEKNKVVSGIITKVGNEFVYLRYAPFYHCKHSVMSSLHKVRISSINKLAVFPRDFKDYGHVYYNGKGHSYEVRNNDSE